MVETNIAHSSGSDKRHFLTPNEILDVLVSLGQHKANIPLWKTLIGSFYAAFYVVFGGMVAITTAGGLDSTFAAAYPSVPKIIVGFTFWIALILIVTYGGELFTGNLMYLFLARCRNRITTFQMLRNWILVFVGNYLGCAFLAYVLAYKGEFYSANPWLSYMNSLVLHKVELTWGVAVVRGIGANWMVCCGVIFSISSQDQISRIFSCFWPVFLFATVGFEHSVANMFYVSLGQMLGVDASLGSFWAKNLIPVAIGNFIGGALFCGGGLLLLNFSEDHNKHKDTEHSSTLKVEELAAITLSYVAGHIDDDQHWTTSFTKRYIRKNGTVVELIVRCVVELGDDGMPTRILSLLRPNRNHVISGDRREHESHLEGFICLQWDGSCSVEECKVTHADKTCGQLLGYSVSELLNLTLSQLTFSGDAELSTVTLQNAIKAKRGMV